MTMRAADNWVAGHHNCPKLGHLLGTKDFGNRKVKSESLVFLKDFVFLKSQSFVMYLLRAVGNYIFWMWEAILQKKMRHQNKR